MMIRIVTTYVLVKYSSIKSVFLFLCRENPLAPFTEIIDYDMLSPTSKKLLKENNARSQSYSAKKMITTLGPRENYVVHFMNLKL